MKRITISLAISLFSIIAYSQHDFRIVGYVMQNNIPKITSRELAMVTHLCIAFINPDENGELQFGPYIGKIFNINE